METQKTEENLIGKVGRCSKGRPGLIMGKKELPWGIAWIGVGLDGRGQWSSRDPIIIAESEEEYEEKFPLK